MMRKMTGGLSPFINFARILTVASVLLLIVAGGVALAESISYSPGSRNVIVGASTTYQIVLDSAPNGLAGFDIDVSVATPATAEIESVSFPSWAAMNNAGSLPAGTVRISGVDVNQQVQTGSTNVVLATITVKGLSSGTTELSVNVRGLDADGGGVISAGVSTGQIVVSTPTPTPTPAPTQTPTQTPTEAPTAAPTATPVPTPTATPTPTPVPSATPSATTPTPTPVPTAEATPEPAASGTSLPLFEILAALGVLGIVAVFVYYWFSRKQ